MLDRIQRRVHKTKQDLRRLIDAHTFSVDRVLTISNQEHAPLDPSSAQPPPATAVPEPKGLHLDTQAGLTSATSRPAKELPIASAPDPEPNHAHTSSTPVSTSILPILEATNRPNQSHTPVIFNSPEGTLRDTKHTTWLGLKVLLGTLNRGADAFGPLKSAVGNLARCIDIFENEAAAREDYAQLRTEINNLCQDISGFISGNAPPSMTSSITMLAQGIEKETGMIFLKAQRSVAERLAEAKDDIDEVTECYRRIQALLNRLSLNANTNMWKIVDEHATQIRLDHLPYSAEAKYQSARSDSLGRSGCTPNTRVEVLEELLAWAQKEDNHRIYWLNGMAGTGKTTIAYSLCEQLQSAGKLAASFFCSRQLPTCRDVSHILPSIAFQLSLCSRPFRYAMAHALEQYPDAHNQPVDLQFDSLIAAPLRAVRDTLPIDLIIVVDALDECEDSGGVGKMLLALLRHASDLPMKVFVTSRPDQLIMDRMGSHKYKHARSELRLHELDRLVVQSDIKTYLAVSLDELNLDSADLDSLTKRSGALFVYASTVVRYITYSPTRSSQRLAEVLSTPTSLDASQRGIDSLYAAILLAALEDEDLTRAERSEMHRILRTVICAQEPLPVALIARFLEINLVESVQASLKALSSVLQVSDTTDQLVTTLHQSFPDYLMDQERYGRFCCQPKEQNAWYAQTCFNLITTVNPAFNICRIESSYIPDRDVEGLNDRVNKSISPELFYACRYWEAHAEIAEPSKVVGGVLYFLSRQLLLWMEIMNLKQNLNDGVGILLRLHAWLRTIHASSEMRQLGVDALRFLTAYASGPVSQLTPHIYVSTLALWPKHRPISRLYSDSFPHTVEASGSAMNRQGAAVLAVLSAPGKVYHVACSPDGTRIASGSADDAIHILDAYTGRTIGQPLEGHTGNIRSVAYSHDSKRIVSGSNDNTIRIWDANTGRMLGQTLQSHADDVTSVAFSPNGLCIVSGSSDQTVRIWDSRTWQALGEPLEGHTGAVLSVAYSSDSAYIVSGSKDGTVRIWDARTRTQLGNPMEGHTHYVHSVAFSPNDMRVVSGSGDKTIRVWDTDTRKTIGHPLQGHTDYVRSVVYSPNGAYIVSGADDTTIRIWDASTGQMLGQPFKGHTDWVYSLTFSPDGLRIISGSRDGSIRIWDAHVEHTLGPSLEGHACTVCSVAYCPDGTQIASGSYDNTICIWGAYTGQIVGQPLNGHTFIVNSVAYSPDGTSIASGSGDHTIRIWDASSGQIVGQPLAGHTDIVWSVVFSPDGSRIASGSADYTVCIWDAHTRQMVGQPLRAHTSTVYSVTFSPDGARLASGSWDNTIRIWDVHTGQMVGQSPKGHTGSVRSIAYSPCGSCIVSGSNDDTIRIWDARTVQMVGQPLKGHTDWVMSVAYSPDGARIVSGSDDRTIRFWDAHTGLMLGQPLEGHTNRVWSVAYSPDGQHVASASEDKSVRIWDVCALPSLDIASRRSSNSLCQSSPSSSLPGPGSSTLNHSARIYEPLTERGFLINPSDQANAWTLSNDGWVVSHDLKPLLWVPPELRGTLLRYGNSWMISTEGSWSLGLSRARFGAEWQQCYRS